MCRMCRPLHGMGIIVIGNGRGIGTRAAKASAREGLD